MKHLQILLLLLLNLPVIRGQKIPDPMIPQRLVNDFTGLLTADQRNSLENKLVVFDDSTSTQICVVTYDDLQGYSANEFGTALFQKWGIGQKSKSNGILILISPRNRQMTIQPGYGLEGAVPDAICKRIIEHEMVPAFRQGNYFKGIDKATQTLMALTKGEFTADEYAKKTGSGGGGFLPVLFVIIIFLVVFSSIASKRRIYAAGKSIPWWILMTMLGSSGHSQKGSYRDFRTGSGGFGGFSDGGGFGGFSDGGGGFGGFGGGSYGGGGASGGW
jgi:uncharacterized protein